MNLLHVHDHIIGKLRYHINPQPIQAYNLFIIYKYIYIYIYIYICSML